MIRRDDLLEAIAECEGVKNPNSHTCMMLSAFYNILDHMDGNQIGYSYSPAPQEEITINGETEFLQAVQGKDTNELLLIMDELMTTLQVLHPRLYDGVMIKIAG
jgi:hypothetical protein